MPTLEQIRAARALLGWSQSDLADIAGLSQTGIARIENGTNHPNLQTIAKIEKAFEEHDIEFIDTSGVRKRSGEIKTLRGRDGFTTFLQDVYNTAKDVGGLFCLHNSKPDNWIKWVGEEYYREHAKRMAAIQREDFEFRITAKEGEMNLISKSFAEYRWIPNFMFNEHSIYAYGHKLAFITFESETVIVRILENRAFAEAFQGLFNIAWEHVAKEPENNNEQG